MTCGVSFFILGMLAAAPQATAQYTCTQNTYQASVFTGGDVVTCNAVDQTSFQACITAFGQATAATIIKIAAGSYVVGDVRGAQALCLQGAGPSKTTLSSPGGVPFLIVGAAAQVIGLTLEGVGFKTAGILLNGPSGIYDVVMQNFNTSAAPVILTMQPPGKLVIA